MQDAVAAAQHVKPLTDVLQGYVRLYAAVTQSAQPGNPHGLPHAWAFLARCVYAAWGPHLLTHLWLRTRMRGCHIYRQQLSGMMRETAGVCRLSATCVASHPETCMACPCPLMGADRRPGSRLHWYNTP